ncbi:glycosyltransferase [Thiocystis violacea]|uniref:glycosyltransferase n=1 Tax=Thiocystis violacea TaxID=13725 RepID=UPI001906E311
MKIILSVDAIRHPLTGIGRYAAELASGLSDYPGIEAVRFYLNGRWLNSVASETRQSAVSGPLRRSLLARARSSLPNNSLTLKTSRQVVGAIDQWRLRRLDDHLFHSPNYFLPRFGGPTIATIHDLSTLIYPQYHPESRVALVNLEIPNTLARASHLITDSAAIRLELINRFGCSAERVSAIALGVDPVFHPREPQALKPRLEPYGLTPGAYCLCVATIEPRKNIQRLIMAHASLPLALRRHYPLILAGETGWRSEEIHASITAAQRTGTVRYLDYLPQEDLPFVFAGAHLFSLPSHYEGFGLPLLEAMASGVPLVTSTCPTLLELAGDVGLVVDPEDTNALAEALRRGMEDDLWRRDASASGLARARQYSWEQCVQSTFAVYQRVMYGRSATDALHLSSLSGG